MKATQLIQQLQKLIDEHGDLDVNYNSGMSDFTVSDIEVYDKKGQAAYHKKFDGTVVEFFIH